MSSVSEHTCVCACMHCKKSLGQTEMASSLGNEVFQFHLGLFYIKAKEIWKQRLDSHGDLGTICRNKWDSSSKPLQFSGSSVQWTSRIVSLLLHFSRLTRMVSVSYQYMREKGVDLTFKAGKTRTTKM